jgi:hypothetical protein
VWKKNKIFRLLIHLVSCNLIDGVEDGGKLDGHCIHEVVDLVLSTCVACLESGYSDQFKSLKATTSALGLP